MPALTRAQRAETGAPLEPLQELQPTRRHSRAAPSAPRVTKRPATKRKRRPRDHDVPPLAGHKHPRDEEGSAGPDRKRRRLLPPETKPKRPTIDSLLHSVYPHGVPVADPTPIDNLLHTIYPDGVPVADPSPHDSYHDPYTGRRRSGWVRPQLRDPFSPEPLPEILGAPRRSGPQSPLSPPAGIPWLPRRLAFSALTPATPSPPDRDFAHDVLRASLSTRELVLSNPAYPIPTGCSPPPAPRYLHGLDAAGAEIWTARDPGAVVWADHFPCRLPRHITPRPDRHRGRASTQFTLGGRSLYRRLLHHGRPLRRHSIPLHRVALAPRTYNAHRPAGAPRAPSAHPPFEPPDDAGSSSEPSAAYAPSPVERRWGVAVGGEGEVVYAVGYDVRGARRWKPLMRYVPVFTERVYGIPPEGRLRVRRPDWKGLGEILVGWDVHGAEDWRPIWLWGYRGPYEEAVGEVGEGEGLEIRGRAERERDGMGHAVPDVSDRPAFERGPSFVVPDLSDGLEYERGPSFIVPDSFSDPEYNMP